MGIQIPAQEDTCGLAKAYVFVVFGFGKLPGYLLPQFCSKTTLVPAAINNLIWVFYLLDVKEWSKTMVCRLTGRRCSSCSSFRAQRWWNIKAILKHWNDSLLRNLHHIIMIRCSTNKFTKASFNIEWVTHLEERMLKGLHGCWSTQWIPWTKGLNLHKEKRNIWVWPEKDFFKTSIRPEKTTEKKNNGRKSKCDIHLQW